MELQKRVSKFQNFSQISMIEVGKNEIIRTLHSFAHSVRKPVYNHYTSIATKERLLEKNSTNILDSASLHCKITEEKMSQLFIFLQRHLFQNPLDLTQPQQHWPLKHDQIQNSCLFSMHLFLLPRMFQELSVGQNPGPTFLLLYQGLPESFHGVC